jgi:RsiW-degrading membrane proteinase PrsW (M82 family)
MSILISILPVFGFLGSLVFLDSYKLVKPKAIAVAILVGCAGGGISYGLGSLVSALGAGLRFDRFYGAPFLEELMKSLYIVVLLRRQKIGFLVDAAVYGFAIGAGFAFVENIKYYLSLPESASVAVWIIRGFGTAIMHGGTTALFAVISKNFSDRSESPGLKAFLPAFTLALVIHSLYNHFFLSPVNSTILILVILPAILAVVFVRSERTLRKWMGVGFDTDQELLQSITSGNLSDTPVGHYLESLRQRFPGEVVVDMLCLLRIHLELSIQAKGILLMRDAGFAVPPDPDVKEKFKELRFLEKNIGPTGKLAMLPFLHTSSRDLWQLHMLGSEN